jgi:hypothetical protein
MNPVTGITAALLAYQGINMAGEGIRGHFARKSQREQLGLQKELMAKESLSKKMMVKMLMDERKRQETLMTEIYPAIQERQMLTQAIVQKALGGDTDREDMFNNMREGMGNFVAPNPLPPAPNSFTGMMRY